MKWTLWIHRTSPDPTLPSNPMPSKSLFGRDPRTQLDTVSPVAATEAMSIETFVEQRKKKFKDIRDTVIKSKTAKYAVRKARNAVMGKVSPGAESPSRVLVF